MLIVEIQNTAEGTNENACYRYSVFVNHKKIECGYIVGHNRDDGWAELVKSIAERHLTPRSPDSLKAGDSSLPETVLV